MIDKEKFLGLNGFVWWIGVIENRKDPLKMGRCQIRIIGWHTDNKALLPTQNLPWAQTLLPMNGSRTINPPRLGEWVVGFFMDGEAAQFPISIGVIPGIMQDTNTSSTNTNSNSTTPVTPTDTTA
jgi:hypothetical protein